MIDTILWVGLGWTVLSVALSFGCGWWLKSLREKADDTVDHVQKDCNP